ncbi:MAG: pyridoxal phosphate-dependent aminotransferase [Polyangiales bacterium]
MFSRRSAHAPTKNRITQVLEATPPAFDLSESNPTRTSLPYPHAELLRALDNPAVRLYQPDPHGLLEARRAVVARMAERGVALDPGQITLASGTSEAYGYLFKLLCDPGDEVLVPEPSYPLFADLCRLEHVHARPYPLHYDGEWHIGLGELAAAIGEQTRAILLVNPNNPTGSYLKQSELATLETLGLPLISDEVFSDYALRPDDTRVRSALVSTRALVFALDGLSKQAGLPQWKVSWICANGPAQSLAEAHGRLELIADTYLSVATPTQHALGQLLALAQPVRAAIHARLQRNLSQLRAACASHDAVSLLDVEGGFYATLRVPSVQSEEQWVLELLTQDSVYVQPGYFFDFPREAYLVLSLLTPETTFDEGVTRLLARVSSHVT